MDNNNIDYNPELDNESASGTADTCVNDLQADIPEINSIAPINSLDDAPINDIPELPEVEGSDAQPDVPTDASGKPSDEAAAAQLPVQNDEVTQTPAPAPVPQMINAPGYPAAPAPGPAFADPRVHAVYPSGNIPQQIAVHGTPVPAPASKPIQQPRNGEWLALAGFLCGIVSVSLTWSMILCYVCAAVALVGIVLAAISGKKGTHTTMQKTGLTLSIIGFVCSILSSACCIACGCYANKIVESIPQDVISDFMQGDPDALADYLEEYLGSVDGNDYDDEFVYEDYSDQSGISEYLDDFNYEDFADDFASEFDFSEFEDAFSELDGFEIQW
ncbi:MAG: hypothetical protein E7554_02675 [Ruminococcaceae bacterium]|nr:hypothetical protein [Oscillospiraceae bacterium]